MSLSNLKVITMEILLPFKSLFFTILVLVVVYYIAKIVLDRQAKGKSDWSIIRTGVLLGILLVGLFATISALPIDPVVKEEITKLMGIVISAVLALGSATFIGNGLAGIMLQTVNSFKPGDFIRINDIFGRVTERSLFHVEIQTENRDLTTIPNLFLTTHPVKVIRSSGTFISGVCSLGYDVNRQKIETALLDAAARAELKDAFVRVSELGDYSVVYTVYGLLSDTKIILSAQSKLNAMILDALHEVNIEIVSPSFMNQRPVGDTIFIPAKPKKHEEVKDTGAPESIIFDKAEEAGSIESRKEKLADVEQKLIDLAEELKTTDATDEVKARIEKWTAVKAKMEERIAEKKDDLDAKK